MPHLQPKVVPRGAGEASCPFSSCLRVVEVHEDTLPPTSDDAVAKLALLVMTSACGVFSRKGRRY